jgi:hypothetical protein
MRIKKFLAVLVSAMLVIGIAPTRADEASDRAAQAEILKAKYLPRLDAQHAELLALKAKLKVEPSLLKQANTVLHEFDTNYAAIVEGLNNPTQAIQPLIDLCEEEVEEFDNYIYHLQNALKQLKTITCIKGKTIKKVVGLKPVCPKGFTKKK